MNLHSETAHHEPFSVLKAILLAAVVSFALGAVAALASNAFADTAKPGVVVAMTDKAPYYKPVKITVKPGETVEWKNDGQSVHEVSTEAQNAQNPKDTSMPKGAEGFDSGFIPPGGAFSYTFKVTGTYKYFCLPHEKAGMVGYVTVRK